MKADEPVPASDNVEEHIGEKDVRAGRSILMISLFLVIFFAIVLYKMVFVQTSVSFESYPKRIFIHSSTPVTLKVVPLNKLGFGIPFKRLSGRFVISEGTDKIEIVRKDRDELVFVTKGGTGRLVILYYTSVVPFPVEIILNIQSSAFAASGSLISPRYYSGVFRLSGVGAC